MIKRVGQRVGADVIQCQPCEGLFFRGIGQAWIVIPLRRDRDRLLSEQLLQIFQRTAIHLAISPQHLRLRRADVTGVAIHGQHTEKLVALIAVERTRRVGGQGAGQQFARGAQRYVAIFVRRDFLQRPR